jgi:hypothetical protein
LRQRSTSQGNHGARRGEVAARNATAPPRRAGRPAAVAQPFARPSQPPLRPRQRPPPHQSCRQFVVNRREARPGYGPATSTMAAALRRFPPTHRSRTRACSAIIVPITAMRAAASIPWVLPQRSPRSTQSARLGCSLAQPDVSGIGLRCPLMWRRFGPRPVSSSDGCQPRTPRPRLRRRAFRSWVCRLHHGPLGGWSLWRFRHPQTGAPWRPAWRPWRRSGVPRYGEAVDDFGLLSPVLSRRTSFPALSSPEAVDDVRSSWRERGDYLSTYGARFERARALRSRSLVLSRPSSLFDW